MDQQKIDRLFREKLDSYEAVPSTQAWAEVEKKIGAKSNPSKLYMIAAAVSLLIITWVVWPQESTLDLTPIAGDVSHPVMIEGPEWSIPVVAKETEEKKPRTHPALVKRPDVQLVAQEPVKKESIIDMKKLEEAPQVEIGTETSVANLDEAEESFIEEATIQEETESVIEQEPEMIKVDLSKVKITYIAAEGEKKQETDSVGAFKKIIALAGKISPGEVLADIKTAKDDFISGGFKTKTKDRTSL